MQKRKSLARQLQELKGNGAGSLEAMAAALQQVQKHKEALLEVRTIECACTRHSPNWHKTNVHMASFCQCKCSSCLCGCTWL